MPKIPSKFRSSPATPHFSNQPKIRQRVANLSAGLSRLQPVPPAWLNGTAKDPAPETPGLEPASCSNYKDLIRSWKKALKWTDGLDCALSVMLSSIISTKAIGDQLWVKIISPPSTGKSTLCEAVSVSSHVFAKSTIRGFHSGFKSPSGQDTSLLSLIQDKTLVIKDGDTLLKSPNLQQILSEGRDIYDRVSRTHYRNEIGKNYTGINLTFILAGTSSLRSIDSSELGERFLDCVVMDNIDEDLEEEVLWRVAHRASRNLAEESDGDASSQYDSSLSEAMALTGGYVNYLRQNAQKLLSSAEIRQEHLEQCISLGKFVAYMRARPSKSQDEIAEREFAARLVSQHVRLTKCLVAVLNREESDREIMLRVRKVALDTSRGQSLDLVDSMYPAGREGIELKTLSLLTSYSDSQTRKILRFLTRIGVVEQHRKKFKTGRVKKKPSWRLTESFTNLYERVVQPNSHKSS